MSHFNKNEKKCKDGSGKKQRNKVQVFRQGRDNTLSKEHLALGTNITTFYTVFNVHFTSTQWTTAIIVHENMDIHNQRVGRLSM